MIFRDNWFTTIREADEGTHLVQRLPHGRRRNPMKLQSYASGIEWLQSLDRLLECVVGNRFRIDTQTFHYPVLSNDQPAIPFCLLEWRPLDLPDICRYIKSQLLW